MVVKVGRSIRIDHVYKNDPPLIRWAFSVYHHYLFRTRMPRVLAHDLPPLDGTRVLIVDDAVDSGGSILAARAFLRERGAVGLKAACLSCTSDRENVHFTSLAPGDYRFPWSVG